jgi:pyrimidine-nucleoside phosphorylase
MRAVDILEKKKFGIELSREEIEFLISGYVAGDVADYQASAFLMACCLKPLSARETADLTDVMRTSGDTIDFEKEIQGYTTDKHSTGGVGDKTTLVLGPLVAACGGVVAKMSGRGLGHTGGTLDKLESIAGFRTELERSEFIRLVNEVGVAVCGQTGNVVPADKKLYALRDVTATVEDTALIAASIMSKKLAISNRGLVLDVKTGKGAFMKTLEGSISLAQRMVEIGSLMNRDVMALITEMSMPLGEAVGNALEVQEALDTLAGNGPADLVDLCAELGGRMLVLGGQAGSTAEGGQKIQVAIENGSGLAKFEQMVEAQGGSLDSLHHLEFADQVQDFLAPESAWVQELDALAIGHAAMKLGAGRATKEDEIDMGVGLKVLKKIGSKVEKGEALVRIYYRSEAVLAEVLQELGEAYTWSSEPVSQPPIILAEITRDSMTRF